ncbi:hypothetical protein KFL_001430010 [Klebsormidium nitens]|uniref:Uncharacterized protein n=1 Tax=Klebsormidium nitens TaxID=105231 RepID=A0A1Y1I5A1_KLENI|nr:hypothetical protein KFL_001430010 [Klebsormidium nitens]|eukprot:GAQ83298.1 hypothetical protein KFL_001430010 [Klebsormidium nitens]
MSAAKPAAGAAAKPATPAGDKRPGSSAGAKGAKAAPGKGKAGDKGANGDAPVAGMLLREEDKEPAPKFPITWHAYGVVVEAAWSDVRLDAAALRASLLAEGTPEWTICEADAIAMAEEIATDPDSTLGGLVRNAKESEAASDKPWLQPDVAARLLAARMELDKGRAHRAEAKRRSVAIETANETVVQAKAVASAASEKLTSAKAELNSAKEAHAALVARFKAQAEPAKEPEELQEGRGRSSTVATSSPSKEALAAAGKADPKAKAAAAKPAAKPPTPAGKTKPGAKADEPALLTQDDVDSSKAAAAAADAAVMAASKELRAAQLKVKEAEEKLRQAQAALEAPFAATWVYWCSNFGADAQGLAAAAAAGSPLRALLHLKESIEPDASKALGSGVAPGDSTSGNADVSGTAEPDLVKGFRGLVAASTLDMPARQIALVECEFKRPKVESGEGGAAGATDLGTNSKEVQKGDEKKPNSRPGTAAKGGDKKPPKGGDKKADKKGGEDEIVEDLGPAAAAEALGAAAHKVADQAIAYEEYQARTKVVNVRPAAADVDMRHYQQLLADVPKADVTVPVMLHCMLEQIVRGLCTPLDLREEETSRAADEAAAYLDAAFGRLGLIQTPRIPPADVTSSSASGITSSSKSEAEAGPLEHSNVRSDARAPTETGAPLCEALDSLEGRSGQSGPLDAAGSSNTQPGPSDSFPFGVNQGQAREGSNGEVGKGTQESGVATGESLQAADRLWPTALESPKEASAVVPTEANGIPERPGQEPGASVNEESGTDTARTERSGEERTGIPKGRTRKGVGNGTGLERGYGKAVVREGDGTAGLLSERPGPLDVVAVEKSMRDLLELPGRKRSWMPAVPLLSEVRRNVDATALRAHCGQGATIADVQRFQRMNAISALEGDPETSQSLFGRRHLETLSADSLAQEWCKSALSLQSVDVSYYPREDSLLVRLSEDSGNAEWALPVERYMPFGDFFVAGTASGLQNAYTLEPRESVMKGFRNSVASGAEGVLCARVSEGICDDGRAEISAYVDGHVLGVRSLLNVGAESEKTKTGGSVLVHASANKPGVSGPDEIRGSPQSADGAAEPANTADSGSGEKSESAKDESEQSYSNLNNKSTEGPVKSRFVGSMEDGSVVCAVSEEGGRTRVQLTGPSGEVVEMTSAGVVTMFDAEKMERERREGAERKRKEAEKVAEAKRKKAEAKASKEAEAIAAEPETKGGKGAEKERPGTAKGKPAAAKPGTPSKADATTKKEANAKAGKGAKEAVPAEKTVLPETAAEVPQAEAPPTEETAERKPAPERKVEIGDSEEALTEIARGVTSSGVVVRVLKGGGMQVLYLDGKIAERNALGGTESHWVVTNNSGERTAVYDLAPEPQPGFPAANAEEVKAAEASAAEAVAVAAEPAEKKPSGKEERAKTPGDKKAGAKGKEGTAKSASKATPRDAKPLAESAEAVTAPEPAPAESAPPVSFPEEKKPRLPRLEKLSSIRVVEVTDPETGVRVVTREDLTMVIISPDGEQRVMHTVDGTRISSSGENWQVEKEGFATVRGKTGTGVSVEMGQSWRATWAQSDGGIVLRKRGVGAVSVLGTKVTYASERDNEGFAEGDECGEYVFDLVSGSVESRPFNGPPIKIDASGFIDRADQRSPSCHVAHSRVFCVREEGHGYELLDSGAFEKYRRRKLRDESCTTLTEPVLGSQENAVAHIFLTRPQSNPQTPSPAPRPARATRPATACKALPALALPSKSRIIPSQERFGTGTESAGNGTEVSQSGTESGVSVEGRWLWADPAPLPIPRIAARAPKPLNPPAPPRVVLFRQIVELPALDGAKRAAIEAFLSRYDTWQKETAEKEASFQTEEDPRAAEEVARADALVERVMRARAEVEGARAEAARAEEEAARAADLLRRREECAREEEERRVAEGLARRTEAEAAKARALEAKRGHGVPCIHDEKPLVEATGPSRPEPRTTLRYFDSEEGIQAALTYKLQDTPSGASHSLPRQTSPTRRTTRQPSPLRATRVATREEGHSFSREVSAINKGANSASAEADSTRQIGASESAVSVDVARSVSAGTSSSAGMGDFPESVTSLGTLESSPVTDSSAGNLRSVSGMERREGGSRGTSTDVYGADSSSRFGKSSIGSPEKTSTLLDVTGRPRKTPVSPPKSILRNEAFAAPNERFLEVEAPVKRVIRTTSTVGETKKLLASGGESLARSGQLSPVKQFTLTPEEVDFGRVKIGDTARQVAPGMAVKIEIAFAPTTPVACETQLEVVTEFNRFLVRISGTGTGTTS